MTVKGLEPEIQRLIAKHKNELKKIKQIHEAELLESDERAAQRYVKMTEELRDQLAKEKEAACARERELCKQRYIFNRFIKENIDSNFFILGENLTSIVLML